MTDCMITCQKQKSMTTSKGRCWRDETLYDTAGTETLLITVNLVMFIFQASPRLLYYSSTHKCNNARLFSLLETKHMMNNFLTFNKYNIFLPISTQKR